MAIRRCAPKALPHGLGPRESPGHEAVVASAQVALSPTGERRFGPPGGGVIVLICAAMGAAASAYQ